MPGLPIARPAAIGFDPDRLQKVFDLLARWTVEGKVLGAGLCVGRHGRMVEPVLAGKQKNGEDAPAIRPDALFLIASPTKPVAMTAVLMLVERGEIALEDAVVRYLPAFTGKGRDAVQIRHLLTHT